MRCEKCGDKLVIIYNIKACTKCSHTQLSKEVAEEFTAKPKEFRKSCGNCGSVVTVQAGTTDWMDASRCPNCHGGQVPITKNKYDRFMGNLCEHTPTGFRGVAVAVDTHATPDDCEVLVTLSNQDDEDPVRHFLAGFVRVIGKVEPAEPKRKYVGSLVSGPMHVKQTCDTCKFRDAVCGEIGDCRFGPPSVGNGGSLAAWPRTLRIHWCREHKPK
jgi:uncharacterized CHY-type Zn-finger protein